MFGGRGPEVKFGTMKSGLCLSSVMVNPMSACMNIEEFDHVFIGSGCAALSLAYRMSLSPALREQSVLLIDPAPKNQNDRTWCSWEARSVDLFSGVESHSWEKMSFFSKAGIEVASESLPFRYRMIRGDRFYSGVLSQLASARATFVSDRVVAVDVDRREVSTASGQVFRARRMIFNSSEQWSGVTRPSRYEIWQHFYGIRIRAKRPVFDPERVHFMDFRTHQEPGVCFLYVLPSGAAEALVEHTVFSSGISSQEFHRERIESYLKLCLGLSEGDYEVMDEESGRIPMSAARFPLARSDQFLNIGSAGGLIKASTGYTFNRIQRDSELILEKLENPTRGLRRVRTPDRFRFYDDLFLNILGSAPQEMPGVFSQLFQRNPLPRILRFLDEDSTLVEEVRIFFGLPWKPFLRALWRHLCGNFSSSRRP